MIKSCKKEGTMKAASIFGTERKALPLRFQRQLFPKAPKERMFRSLRTMFSSHRYDSVVLPIFKLLSHRREN